MSKKSRTQTQSGETTMDPHSQAALDDYRQRTAARIDSMQPGNGGPNDQVRSASLDALGFGAQTGVGGIADYMNPYESQVVGGIQTDFVHQRAAAGNAADDEATRAGAFGGDRASVLKAQLMNGVNQNEASTLAGVRTGGYNNALTALQQDRSRAGQLGLAGYGMSNQAINDALQQYGYSLGFGGKAYGQTGTQTPSFWDTFNQWAGNAASVAAVAA